MSAVDCERRTIWIVDAHRGDGKHFVVRADEKLTAFAELESAIRKRQGEFFKRNAPSGCQNASLRLGLRFARTAQLSVFSSHPTKKDNSK